MKALAPVLGGADSDSLLAVSSLRGSRIIAATAASGMTGSASLLGRPARDAGGVDLEVLVLRQARLVQLALDAVERGGQLEAQLREVIRARLHLDRGPGHFRGANDEVDVDPRRQLAHLRRYGGFRGGHGDALEWVWRPILRPQRAFDASQSRASA